MALTYVRATDTVAGVVGFGSRRSHEREKRIFVRKVAENIQIDDRFGIFAVMNDERLTAPRPEAAVQQHRANAVAIHRPLVHRKRIETYR